MNELIIWMLALLGGSFLGVFFFGGLWWTIQKGLTARNPALWFLGSLLVRTAVVLVGFYFVAGGELGRMLACLAGFLLGRLIVTQLKRNKGPSPESAKTIES